MNIILWIFQIFVSLVFLATGVLKVSQPKDKLEQLMSWVKGTPTPMVKIIGTLEIVGAVGLIFPALTGILPWLTPVAGVGLSLTMIGAIATHVQLKEFSRLWMPGVLLVLAVFIAYGRFIVAPIIR